MIALADAARMIALGGVQQDLELERIVFNGNSTDTFRALNCDRGFWE